MSHNLTRTTHVSLHELQTDSRDLFDSIAKYRGSQMEQCQLLKMNIIVYDAVQRHQSGNVTPNGKKKRR